MEREAPAGLEGVFNERTISIAAAVRLTGYTAQYLRRLAQRGVLEGEHVGRVWLLKQSSLEAYVNKAASAEDSRFGPRHRVDG